MKNKAKESWLKWLGDNGAIRIKELDCDEFAYQIHGYVNDHYCVGFFRTNHVTLTAFGKTYFDITLNEFEEKLKTLKEPETEYTLERFKLKSNEQLIMTHEMCPEELIMCSFYEIKQRLN